MPYSGNVSPAEAWEAVSAHPQATLVDVRSHAEWLFAGLPDLSALGKDVVTVSWKLYPNFDLNPQFIAQLEAAAPDKSAPLYFLCKTGGRSTDAAIAATAAGYAQCYNITGGFEGDMNNQRQRGTINGWKAAGLAWLQA
ncbi:MAG: sulfurtransferase [Azospirillum brasilense]|nr:MAG: sulfurtransferase [Azospirillum brasilense]